MVFSPFVVEDDSVEPALPEKMVAHRVHAGLFPNYFVCVCVHVCIGSLQLGFCAVINLHRNVQKKLKHRGKEQ